MRALRGSSITRRTLASIACAPLACALLAACDQLPGRDERPPYHASFLLSGTWAWAHVVDEPGMRRLERETWRWMPAEAPGALRGHYLREVTVRSTGLPFACNQAMEYRQRAWFEVRATSTSPLDADGADLEIRERASRHEPSPCDHGFRKLGGYRAFVDRGRAVLVFPEGRQTLWRTGGESGPLPPPWEAAPPGLGGAWQWTSEGVDEQGLWRREEERWELATVEPPPPAAEHVKVLDGVYLRRVVVSSLDGAPISCAGAPSYGFEDRYIVDGKRRGPLIALRETAVAAGAHPCLRDRPDRSLDAATLEQMSDSLVLDWRGKRRQILRRAP